MEEKFVCSTGSTRSKVEERYDLIPPEPLRRLALRYALGAEVHGEGNWLLGQEPKVVVNHMLRHLDLYRGGDRDDDHLAAIAWGAFALMQYEKTHAHLFEGFGQWEYPYKGFLCADIFPRQDRQVGVSRFWWERAWAWCREVFRGKK